MHCSISLEEGRNRLLLSRKKSHWVGTSVFIWQEQRNTSFFCQRKSQIIRLVVIERYWRVRFPRACAKIDQGTVNHLKNLSCSGPA